MGEIESIHCATMQTVRGANGMKAPGRAPKLQHAAKELESYFLSMMLTEMRKTVPKSGLLDGGFSGEMYTSMFNQFVAKEMCRSRSMGLSQLITRDLQPVVRGNVVELPL